MQISELHYALIGDGRLARHMRHYLGLQGVPCSGWSRNAHSPFNSTRQPDARKRLEKCIEPASHVLLLVSDDAITRVLRRYPELHRKTLVHCAGALSVPGVAAVHPLMTFADSLYPIEKYRQIPFMIEAGYDFEKLFPALPNPHYIVNNQQRACYHAMCVMAGNFPQLLWRAICNRFEGQLSLPREVLEPYLQQVLDNFIADPSGALTGPLARGDTRTQARNETALRGDPLHGLYLAFTRFHAEESAGPAPQRRELSS